MVTSLVCIWRVDFEADILDWVRGRGVRVVKSERGREKRKKERSLHGGDVKSRFSCNEESISSFLLTLFSLSLTPKHTQAPSSQSVYPQLWEFRGISVIVCLYLRNALSGLRALLISGGLDWLLSAEHTW